MEKADKSDIVDIDKKKCARGVRLRLCVGRSWSDARPHALQVPGASRPDRGPVRVRDPQTHQVITREGYIYFREQRVAAYRCAAGAPRLTAAGRMPSARIGDAASLAVPTL